MIKKISDCDLLNDYDEQKEIDEILKNPECHEIVETIIIEI